MRMLRLGSCRRPTSCITSRAVLRDLRYNGDAVFARFSAPKAKIIWYYRSLVNEYRAGGVTHLVEAAHR